MRTRVNKIVDTLRNNKGQVFPFFILILVVILIAVMAYVNLSQVDTHKIDTMNAADAAALAAAAPLAQAANSAADVNENYMKPAFWIEFGTGAVRPATVGNVFGRAMQWYSFMFSHLVTYLDTALSCYKAVQSSAAIAHSTALSAAGIDEAQERQGSPTGERVKSKFSKYMDNLDFYNARLQDGNPNPLGRDKNPTSITYEWFPYEYNFTQERQVQPDLGNYARAESVSTKVLKPAENALELVPMEPIPQITVFFAYCGIPCVLDCLPPVGLCAGLLGWPALMVAENIAAMAVGVLLATATNLILEHKDMYDSDAPPGLRNVLPNLIAMNFTAVGGWVQPWPVFYTCFCPSAACRVCASYWSIGGYEYMVAVPWIKDIKNDDAGVKVQVSRFSPTKDLGLWQFQHGNITSSAYAHIYGGSVNRYPGGYKIKVGGVWDGSYPE